MALYDEADVAPESSPDIAAPPVADPSSAGTQNTEQGQQVTDNRGNVIPGWRVNEMISRATEQTMAQARQEFAREREQLLQTFSQQSQTSQQALLQGLQQRSTQQSRTPEQEQERRVAAQALRELQSDDPNYARIDKAAQLLPELAQMIQRMQDQQAQSDERLQQAESRAFQGYARGETSRLQQMAAQSGLTFQSAEQFKNFENHVTYVIGSNPQALAAFQAGDPGVLPAAFKLVRQQYAAPQQQQRAAFAQTKTATGRLPRPMGGGVPGSAATPEPKFDPNDTGSRERAIWKNIRTASTDIAARHAG